MQEFHASRDPERAASLGGWSDASSSRRTPIVAALLLLAGSLSAATAAQTVSPSPEEIGAWEPVRLLEGSWEGEISGGLGVGRGVRSYRTLMDGVYTEMRGASIRLPQEPSPAGDFHREIALFSYDRERQALVLREFMVEGYVVRSTCDTEPLRLVCTAEAVESGPGIRARLTIDITDPFRFVERYELAFPGDELELLFTNTWTRAPTLDGLQ